METSVACRQHSGSRGVNAGQRDRHSHVCVVSNLRLGRLPTSATSQVSSLLFSSLILCVPEVLFEFVYFELGTCFYRIPK